MWPGGWSDIGDSGTGKSHLLIGLCAAIIDRLTFHGTIIETGTDSYRLAHTRQTTPNWRDRCQPSRARISGLNSISTGRDA